MTLTDFLLARIAEDEAAAHDWPIDGKWGLHSPGTMWMDPMGRPIYAPRARVLAECEGKRRIIDVMQAFESAIGNRSNERTIGSLNGLRIAVKELALPYAEHPDYREEWRA